MKKFIPDFKAFGSINWAKPAIGRGNWAGTALAVLSLLMVVFVFLPWFHWEYTETIKETTTLEAVNKLGITTIWGILGFLVALVALVGSLYKQYALTFWAAILALIFGCFGTDMITGFEFSIDKTDYIVFEEGLKLSQMKGEFIPVTHVGANLFFIAAALLVALSLVELLKKEEDAKAGCLAQLAFAVSAVVAFVICLDAALVTPSFLSTLAMKMLAWNLPLIAVLLVAFAFVKGEGKSLNLVSVALLVVAFFFTNPATIESKYDLVVKNDVKNITTHFDNAHNASVIESTDSYKDVQKAYGKLSEKQAGEKVQEYTITNVSAPEPSSESSYESSSQQGSNSQDAGESADYYYEY